MNFDLHFLGGGLRLSAEDVFGFDRDKIIHVDLVKSVGVFRFELFAVFFLTLIVSPSRRSLLMTPASLRQMGVRSTFLRDCEAT